MAGTASSKGMSYSQIYCRGRAPSRPVSRKPGIPVGAEGDSPRKGDAAALSGKATKSGAEPLSYKAFYR